MTRFLFVSDLDNTLVGDDRALEQLNRRLGDSASAHGSKIVYITGRSLALYRQLAAEKKLLAPDALVTAVGTEIYYATSDGVPDPAWSERLPQGWDREQVVAVAAQFSDLVVQPDMEQAPFKVSYFLTGDAAPAVLPYLNASLRERALATQLIYSNDKDLDILPERGNKGLAMQFLRDRWGFDATQTVACGDSGNDIALFGAGDERGIIVGNARPELLQWYETNSSDCLYLARSHYAEGILEGLHHFGFLGTNDGP